MKRIEFELPEFHSFSGCDELIEFMVENYDIPYVIDAEFQGDFIKMGMLPVTMSADTFMVWDAKDENLSWFIEDLEDSHEIKVTPCKGVMDLTSKAFSAIIPNYVKQELIEVLQGK